MNVEIFLNENYKPPRWCVWIWIADDGNVAMHSDPDWSCREDAEQFALEEMLE